MYSVDKVLFQHLSSLVYVCVVCSVVALENGVEHTVFTSQSILFVVGVHRILLKWRCDGVSDDMGLGSVFAGKEELVKTTQAFSG